MTTVNKSVRLFVCSQTECQILAIAKRDVILLWLKLSHSVEIIDQVNEPRAPKPSSQQTKQWVCVFNRVICKSRCKHLISYPATTPTDTKHRSSAQDLLLNLGSLAEMDDFSSISLLSLAMLVGCYVAGTIPLAVNFSEVSFNLRYLCVQWFI